MVDKDSSGVTSPAFSPIDFALLILALAAPYLADGAWARTGAALGALVAWVVVVQPGWRGLQGFFSVLALVIHSLTWLAIATWAALVAA